MNFEIDSLHFYQIGIGNPLIAKFAFDGAYGPYEVFVQNITRPAMAGFPTPLMPQAAVSESSESSVDIQFGPDNFGSNQEPVDLKVWFYKK